VKAHREVPFFRRNGIQMPPRHGRTFHCINGDAADFVVCCLNSSLFYYAYSAFCDCEHVNDDFVRAWPIPANWEATDWGHLATLLAEQLALHAERKTIRTSQGHVIEYDEMNAAPSKPIIDEIDRALARHYGFTDEELDFIINYDIKYRMGL